MRFVARLRALCRAGRQFGWTIAFGAAVSLAPGNAGAVEPRASGDLRLLVEQATVTVLVERAGGASDIGAGFFVARDLVVTNAHIAPSGARRVFVLSARLDGPVEATLLASENQGLLRRDLAVLRLDRPQDDVTPLALARGVALSGVLAAGFPGLEIEAAADAFLRDGGDLAAPTPTISQGLATQRQQNDATTILSHSAPTAKGSSGGPLVDECGRAVGVSSWVRDDRVDGLEHRVSLAQDAETIRDFLAEHGVATAFDESACAP